MPVDQSGFAHGAIHGSDADMRPALCKRRLHPADTVIPVIRMLSQYALYLDQKNLSRAGLALIPEPAIIA